MYRNLILAGAFAAAACSPSVDEGTINTVEANVRQGLSGRGEVKQVELTRADENRMEGFATVAVQGMGDVRFACTATRDGTRTTVFNWNCTPPQQPAAPRAQAAAAPAGEQPAQAEEGAEQGAELIPTGGKNAGAGAGADGLRAQLVGEWSSNGCKSGTRLGEDGVFESAGGARGRWTIENNQLIFTGPGGRNAMDIVAADGDSWTAGFPDGTRETLTRCE